MELQRQEQMSFTEKELLKWKKYIPIGYRFVPTDYELLKHYLLEKVHDGFILPGIIHEADIYQCHPANLPGLDKGEDFCYYFTTRDQTSGKSERIDRSTKDGKGHWRMTSKLTPLYEVDGSKTKLGRKNTLVYNLNKPSGVKKDMKTNWIMYEYVLDESLYSSTQVASTPKNKTKRIVLCRIYERNKKAAEEEKSQIESNIGGIQSKDTDHHHINSALEFNHQKENGTYKRKGSKGKSTCNNTQNQTSNNIINNVGETTLSCTNKVDEVHEETSQQEIKSRLGDEQTCELSANHKMKNRRLLKSTTNHHKEPIEALIESENGLGNTHEEREDNSPITNHMNQKKSRLSTQIDHTEGAIQQLKQCIEIVYDHQYQQAKQ